MPSSSRTSRATVLFGMLPGFHVAAVGASGTRVRQRCVRNVHDLGAVATSIILERGHPIPEAEVEWLHREMRARSLEHAASQLVDYAIRLTSSLSSLSFEERFLYARVLVDIESLAAFSVVADATKIDALQSRTRAALWSARRAVVGAISAELERADVHGSAWWLPVMIGQRLAR